MIINKKYTLTYCSNIFKANNINKLTYNISKYTKNIKNTNNIGISFCISNYILKNLNNKNILLKLRNWQTVNKLYIPSINGFVYQKFHAKNIKENIYLPDWSSIDRLYFTKKLIVLASLLKINKKIINISTLPISYKKWFKQIYSSHILYTTCKNINTLINNLIYKKCKIQHSITIDMEPEPTCVLEHYKNLTFFFKKWLNIFKTKYLTKHIGICYDICHLSTMFNKHEIAVNILKEACININKIQISSGLKIIIPKKQIYLLKIKKQLLILKKSDFLHQFNLKKQKKIEKHLDITDIFNILEKNKNNELRIHCHIPIYKKKFKNMDTTNIDIEKIIKLLKKYKISKNLEIETYTKNLFFNKINCKKSIKKEYYMTIKNTILC